MLALHQYFGLKSILCISWRLIVSVMVLMVFCAGACWGSEENLDELFRRKTRHAVASWGPQYLESSTNHFWQPETVCYSDTQTGREVWRMTNTPSRANFYGDIGFSHWSANGKRLAFVSDRDTQAFKRYDDKIWMIVNSDGQLLRPIKNGPAKVYAHTPYIHWSPSEPDVYYEFGRNYTGEAPLDSNLLYRTVVTDRDVTSSPLLDFLPGDATTELVLFKTISPDGKKIVALRWYATGPVYPATINQDGTASTDDPDGYAINRNLDTHWGATTDPYTTFHDQYMTYNAEDGYWLHFMPESTNGTWWRMRLNGSASDGGPKHTLDRSVPYDWGGEIEPTNTVTQSVAANDPWCLDDDPNTDCSSYWSHFQPDRWGRYALFSNGQVSPYGPGVYDIKNHRYLVPAFGGAGAQHHSWSAWSDWTVSSMGPARTPDNKWNYLSDRLYVQICNDPRSQKTLCYTHTRYNVGGTDSGSYEALTRPTQSPDGTKVAFHSTFLNNAVGGKDSSPDLFYVVAYYPYPPKVSGAENSGASIRLKWQWDGESKYTNRGWPNEATDAGPVPRETKPFHIWVSEDMNAWKEITTSGVDSRIFFLDLAQPAGSTRYYAVTSEEHSRLESRTLSNVLKVSVDNSGNITNGGGNGEQVRTYPKDPGGIDPFWTTPPPAPGSFTSLKQSTPGHHILSWSEPRDSKIRYYNIYYAKSGNPPADQRYRIASVPVGTSQYLDWSADPNTPAYYRITSVDRQGNEGLDGPDQSPAKPGRPQVVEGHAQGTP